MAVSELKKSVKYLIQSATGKDSIESFLQRLGEYSDSIIVQKTDEGKMFRTGLCILQVNDIDANLIDINLLFDFYDEQNRTEEYKYANQVLKQNFTDDAYEELRSKNMMKFQIVR
jgi:hypothetical protein